MKCPHCGKTFDPMTAKSWRGVKRTVIYCSLCNTEIEVEGSAKRKKPTYERRQSR